MTKLNDTQVVILSTAARRADGTVLPVSAKLKVTSKTVRRTLNRMLDAGLVEEQPAAAAVEIWRESKEHERLMLVLTDDGRRAIGVEIETDDRPAATTDPAPRRVTKRDQLVNLLSRPEGGSIAEAMAVTGWQAHSIRGAISGALKKNLGLTISSDADEVRGRVYRIVEGA